MTGRRTILLGMGAAVSAAVLTRGALAQPTWPARPVSILIGNAPGGDDDTLSRYLAEKITPELGQAVVVENRVGGSTTLAGAATAFARPDGYTLLCLITAGVIQTVLRDNLQYGLDDFKPIISIGGYPLALIASAKSGITTMEDVLAAAHSAEGITFASGGVGTMGHLTGVLFMGEIAGNGVHVSYRNNPEGIQALVGGFTQMIFASAREAAILKDDPNLRVLAVTSEERTLNLPDVPTVEELGYPGIRGRVWYSYAAPADTPDEVVAKLAEVIAAGVNSTAFQERFAPLSFQTEVRTGPELAAFLESEAAHFSEIITKNAISVE